MAYEKYIARMTLRDSSTDDTFPERHVSEPPSESSSQPGAQDKYETNAAHFQRRPRRRSESIEGYEMRNRYLEAIAVIHRDLKDAAKAPAVWNYVYDPVCLPPSGVVKTPAICQLGKLSIRRAWRRRNSRDGPDLTLTHTIEAIMLYERGTILSEQSKCTNCRRGQGISPGCVVLEHEQKMPEHFPSTGDSLSTCSNCLYDGADRCDARVPSLAPSQPSRSQTPSQIKRSFASHPGHLQVLDMVEKLLKSKDGDGKHDIVARAKQIEIAALEIAQAAHEWGLGARDKRRKSADPPDSTN
ncbi:hypothetical protein F4821DRAFT_272428 [Hypoxylon rubiginosum]|uniref:Uncharacterized protein n=1 Tax=Hypoxylon rubiginosum TaxID=110542 RepID=A0ACC0CQH0_9PEZI|nr:hypothetical protein F4821DRAFT_272428 [Hypoxylon rubiginosum]